MSIDLSASTLRNRLNPEFIGMAKRLSSSKQQRQSLEHDRNQQLRLLNYKINVDLQLSKNIEDQSDKLKTVKKIHTRKVQEDAWKQEHNEIKASRLRSLSSTIKEKKEQQKRSLRNAMLHTFNKHRKSCVEQKQIHEAIEERIRQNNELHALKNRKRFQEVKRGEKQSQNTVNNFYRTLNKDSVNAYKHWINEEQYKAQIYRKDIEEMQSAIEKYDVAIDKKRNKLMGIFSQIESYTCEPTSEQSKCLPYHLREPLTSCSSRPRDILLRSSKELKEPSTFGSTFA